MQLIDEVRWVLMSLTFLLFLVGVMPGVTVTGNSYDLTYQSTVVDSEPDSRMMFLAGITHDPIAIDGDDNFTTTALAEEWPGDGSLATPYVIDDLFIDRNATDGNCIDIQNTRVNFTISNCILTNLKLSSGRGIYLYNVSNAYLVNNTCMTITDEGVLLDSSDFNTIEDNTCSNNSRGVHLLASSSNQVVNNTCIKNSLDGIYLQNSNSNNVSGNICDENTLYGIQLYSPGGQSTVGNNVTENSCYKNGDTGIYCSGNVFQCDFLRNTCYNNTVSGIEFDNIGVGQHEVYNNTCSYNFYGIYISSTVQGITIKWNIFENSTDNAYDTGGNLFDYNYYSDYTGLDADKDGIGDTPYTIGPGTDSHPLIIPPGRPSIWWVEEPIDQVCELGDTFYYDLNVTSYGESDQWWLDDSTNFTIASDGIITNNTVLIVVGYPLQVSVNDTYGKELNKVFIIDVQDTTPPSWIETPVDQYLGPIYVLHYDLNATDLAGLKSWWINDTVHFSIDADGIITNATILDEGLYGLEVFVSDNHDVAQMVVIVISVDLTAPYRHAPIVINGNSEFEALANAEIWIGNGSKQDPYVIENFQIDLKGEAGHCIDIQNTNVYFIIQNCILTGANVSPGAGIYLYGVAYGTIFNCTSIGNVYGIFAAVDRTTITLNNCSHNSGIGITLFWYSDYNLVENNTCNYNYRGVFIERSRHNVLVNNSILHNTEYGVYLRYDTTLNTTIFLNDISYNGDSGIYLAVSHGNTIANNTVSDNGYHGIQLHDSDSVIIANNTCTYNVAGIALYSSSSNTIVNNDCNYNTKGAGWGSIYVYWMCYDNVIANNTCMYNTWTGISIRHTSDNTVANNTCSFNTHYGIYIEYGLSMAGANFNTVTNNTCSFNSQYGIYIATNCKNNTILWNTLMNNSLGNALDNGANNTIDYNYWSDYAGTDTDLNGIGDSSHPISGGATNEDYHPLMLPPDRVPLLWLETPLDQVIEFGDSFLISLSVFTWGEIDEFWLNDTSLFDVTSEGVISNITSLPVGNHGLKIQVNDTYNNLLTATISVRVQDTTSPIWAEDPIDYLLGPTDIFICDLNATDLSGISYWWLNDTVSFNINSNGVITNITTLSDGAYGLQIWVNDTQGNLLTSTFEIIVDITPPTWDQVPSNYLLELGDSFRVNLNATDPRGLSIWWLNDTISFQIDEWGVVTNASILQVDIYGLQIWVNDTIGNTQWVTFNVQVVDTTPPVWIDGPVDIMLEYGEEIFIDFNATDLSGIDTYWVDDIVRFSIDWAGRFRSLGVLSIGDYGVSIYVQDTRTNILFTRITIFVRDTAPPLWIEEPQDQFLGYNESLNYPLEATDISGIDTYWVDDTYYFIMDEDGILTNATIMYMGTYGLIVSVNDTLGNILSTSFYVHIIDKISPEWLSEVTDQYLEYGEELDYQLSAHDYSGIDHWTLNDTLNFDISTTGRITNNTILISGNYGLLVSVFDSYGNEISAIFSVFVSPLSTTTTTTTTTAVTTTTSTSPIGTTTTTPPTDGDFTLFIIIGITFGGVAIVIVILVFLRKRGSG